jgi:CRP/FNR family transcriptional regulator, cyclic AMP receptor protein
MQQRMGPGQGFWTLLSKDEQGALSGIGLPRHYSPGTIICHEGDPDTHLYILTNGWVKIRAATADGHEIVLALRGDGEIVGEVAGETTGRRNATMQAIDAVDALMVRYDKFSSFLDANPGADRVYRRVMTRKWNDTDTTLRSRTGTTGAQRLARILLDLADRRGHAVNGAIHLALPLTQDELASLAGTSRATVTRALSNWRKRGFIRTAHRHVTIVDMSALKRVMGPSA